MLSCRFLVLVLGITKSISGRVQADAFETEVLGLRDSIDSMTMSDDGDFKCCKIENGWFGHWSMHDKIRMKINSESNTLCKQHIGTVYTKTCYEKDYKWPEHRIYTPSMAIWENFSLKFEMRKSQLRIEKFDTRPKIECDASSVPWCSSVEFVTPRLSQGAQELEQMAVEANASFTPKTCGRAASDALFDCNLDRWKEAATALTPKFQEEATALKNELEAKREKARREERELNRAVYGNGAGVRREGINGFRRDRLLPQAGGTYGQSAIGRINTRATGIYHP